MSTLVIGYGNPSRQDDGVGLAVVNGLRLRLGLPVLDETIDGFEDLGQGSSLDTLFLQQLTPELSETLSNYDRVVFVDAHAGTYAGLVHYERLQPGAGPSLVSHHLLPGNLLAIAKQLFGAAPTAELISIRGFSFDFGSTLSPATAQGVETVVDDLWQRYRV